MLLIRCKIATRSLWETCGERWLAARSPLRRSLCVNVEGNGRPTFWGTANRCAVDRDGHNGLLAENEGEFGISARRIPGKTVLNAEPQLSSFLPKVDAMKKLAALVFPGFQTLDLQGPLEMLGDHDEGSVDIKIIAETLEPVPSYHGTRVVPDRTLADGTDYDLLLIPGGDSAPLDPVNQAINAWIVETSKKAEYVMAVCTGTVLLATTGLLDGRRATTNKKDFLATIHHGPNVEWVKEARWVEDGKFITSSGRFSRHGYEPRGHGKTVRSQGCL